MDEWFQDLREMGDAVQPGPEARTRIHRQLRRRRRQRTIGGATGAAAMVGIVAVGIGVLPDQLGSDKAPADPASSPATGLFDCPRMSRIVGDGPAIPDRERQEQIVDAAKRHASTQFDVRAAEPSHLGVVALVTGDLAAARRLLPEVGVRHVFKFDPPGPSPSSDGTAGLQIQQLLHQLMEPAMKDVRAASRGITGDAGLSSWPNAGAVFLQWKRPIPAQIQQLEGTRPDGVRVIVDPVRFSAAETHKAEKKLANAADRLDAEVTSLAACGDDSGMVVGIEPKSLGDRRAELQNKMAAIAKMPVYVVSQRKGIWLTPGSLTPGPAE